MPDSSSYSLERLADRAAIQDCMLKWLRAVDRREWALVNECFHSDATDDHGIYKGDIQGLVAWLSQRHETISFSQHHLGNMLIEFAGPDKAVAESYCVAYQRYYPGSEKTRSDITGGADTGSAVFDMVMNGRYVDVFERRNSVWRISRRTVVFDSSMMFPVPADGPKLGADWPVGKRDRNDPLWKIRREAGLS